MNAYIAIQSAPRDPGIFRLRLPVVFFLGFLASHCRISAQFASQGICTMAALCAVMLSSCSQQTELTSIYPTKPITIAADPIVWLENEVPNSQFVTEDFPIDRLIDGSYWIAVSNIPCGCIDVALERNDKLHALLPGVQEYVSAASSCRLRLNKRVSNVSGVHTHNVDFRVFPENSPQSNIPLTLKMRHEVLRSTESVPSVIDESFGQTDHQSKTRTIDIKGRSRQKRDLEIAVLSKPDFVDAINVTEMANIRTPQGIWERVARVNMQISAPKDLSSLASGTVTFGFGENLLLLVPIRSAIRDGIMVQPQDLVLVPWDNRSNVGRVMIRSNDGIEFRIRNIALSSKLWHAKFDVDRLASTHWIEFRSELLASELTWEAELDHAKQAKCRGKVQVSR